MVERPARSPIDATVLGDSAGGDAALGLELLHIFRERTLPDALRLGSEPDKATRRALAHKVQGAALIVGAHSLAEMAGAVERGEATDLHTIGEEVTMLSAWIEDRLVAERK